MFRRKKINEDIFILKKNINIIYNGIFGFSNEIQVESGIAFARYLNTVGMDTKNYQMFLKILETNNKWIVDELIGKGTSRGCS